MKRRITSGRLAAAIAALVPSTPSCGSRARCHESWAATLRLHSSGQVAFAFTNEGFNGGLARNSMASPLHSL
jgi:hypothetical protein